MEGACGKIVDTTTQDVVTKVMHTHKRKAKTLSVEDQVRLQEWARNVMADYKILFVPAVVGMETNSYSMKRVDVSEPLEMLSVEEHGVFSEVKQFFAASRGAGIFPADFELYLQPDGRVALLDFDKFSIWNPDGSVLFPWGSILDAASVKNNFHCFVE